MGASIRKENTLVYTATYLPSEWTISEWGFQLPNSSASGPLCLHSY